MNYSIIQKMSIICSLFICFQTKPASKEPTSSSLQDFSIIALPDDDDIRDSFDSMAFQSTSKDYSHDDLADIELGETPELTADDLMPLIPKSRNVSTNERRAHIEHVLARSQARRGASHPYLVDLQSLVAMRKKRGIGLPIEISEDHIKPALQWLGKKVLKEDLELVNRKFDRQKVITGCSTVGAFIISSGVACLIAYLGSLY